MSKKVLFAGALVSGLVLSACTSPKAPPSPSETKAIVVHGAAARERLGPDRMSLLSELERRYGARAELVVNVETGFVTLLRFATQPETDVAVAASESRATRYLADHLALLAPGIDLAELFVVDDATSCHTPDRRPDPSSAPLAGTYRFERRIEEVPVAGENLLVRFGTNGEVRQIENHLSSAQPTPFREFALETSVFEHLLPEPRHSDRVLEAARSLLVPTRGDDGKLFLDSAKLLAWSGDDGQPRSLLTLAGGGVLGPWDTGPAAPTRGRVHIDSRTGLPDFISFRDEGGRSVPSAGYLADPARLAYAFLESNREIFRSGSPVCQFQTVRSETPATAGGATYVRLEQAIAGYPVDGAQLVFEIVDGRIMSVAGHILPDAGMPLFPEIGWTEAANRALEELLQMGAQLPGDESTAFLELVGNGEIADNELLIHPGQLVSGEEADSRLAYRVSISNFALYVDAITSELIFAKSLQTAANIVRDGAGTGVNPVDQSAYVTINVDGVPQAAPAGFPLFPADIARAVTDITTTAAFFAAHGTGLPNFVAITNVVMAGCPNNAFFDWFLSNQAYFCLGSAGNDIMIHEFTHGLIAATSGLIYLDEAGALNESYSDIMGNLGFPDAAATPPTWLVGETTVGGAAVRNMANPAAFGDPVNWSGYLSRTDLLCPAWDLIGLTGACDFGGVHSNSGINNRAHVFLSDGRPGLFTGIGRPKMETLAFDVMARRLTPFSRMIDAAMATRESCALFAGAGARAVSFLGPTPRPTFTPADCDVVPLAFEAVGLDPDYVGDWTPRVLGFSGTIARFPGETTDNGCNVNDVQLQMATPSGLLDASVLTGGPTPTINYLGIATATIPLTAPPIGTTGKTHLINWTNSFGFSPTLASSISTFPPPAGQLSCNAPVGTTPVERFSAVRVHTIIPDGFGGTTLIGNPASTMNPACVLTGTEVELVDGAGAVLAGPAPTARFTKTVWVPTPFIFPVPVDVSIAATVVPPLPAGPPNLTATVNWSIDLVGYLEIRYRLHYHVNQPVGITCTP